MPELDIIVRGTSTAGGMTPGPRLLKTGETVKQLHRSRIARYDSQTTTGTSAETLYSDAIPAATFASNGGSLKGSVAGSSSNNANAKTVGLLFAGTSLLQGVIAANIRRWIFQFTITREDYDRVRYWVMFFQDSGITTSYNAIVGLNLTTTAYNLDVQGTTAVAGNATVTMSEVSYHPAP